jgi:hypothetical protein
MAAPIFTVHTQSSEYTIRVCISVGTLSADCVTKWQTQEILHLGRAPFLIGPYKHCSTALHGCHADATFLKHAGAS